MHTGRVLPGKTCKVNHSMIHFLLYCGQRYLNKIHASDFPDRVNLNKIHSVPPPKSAPVPRAAGRRTRYPHCRKGRATGPCLAACGPARRRRMPCRETNLLMLKLYFPPRCRLRWLIPGLLPAGLSLLAGASKAGKSWLCLWLLPAAGPGRRDLGPHHPATDCTVPLSGGHLRPHPGAFVPPDRGLRSQPVILPDRKLRHRGRTGTPDREIPVPPPRNRAGGYRHLAEGPHCRPEQRRLRQRLPGYERAEIPGGPPRIGLLLVHHLRKQGASDPFQQISGSNGLMGAADTIWLLQRQRMSGHGPAAGDGP